MARRPSTTQRLPYRRGEPIINTYEASARYGKERGRLARLNARDCFIYAVIKAAGASISTNLYEGEDLSKKDIESAS